jgi:uncharacterized membrane protein YfcA
LLHSLSALQIGLILGILLISGLTKGVLGVGLPLIAVPLLSQIVPVPEAIMTLLLSQVLSNGYQAVQGGHLGLVLRRFWPLFLPMIIGVFFGARLLVSLDQRMLSLIVGGVLLLFVAIDFFPRLTRIEVHHERLISPLVGALCGFMGGVSSFYGPPALMYMVALRLPKELFISAASTAFFLGGLPLMVSLVAYGALGKEEFIFSAASAVPVFAGLLLGQQIQNRLPQAVFRKAIFAFLALLGLSLVLRALFE